MNISKKIKFNKHGLIPVIIQDYKNNQILMLAYMNEEAFNLTLKKRKVHFFSRSRNKLWLKGETSGNFQLVKSIYFDCDSDTLLIKVSQKGGACHEGYRSCFFRKLTPKGGLKVIEKKVFDEKKVYRVNSNIKNQISK
jgi:phosphoribosyl-ATP pyrophosphohydrolase/phosphoribosyl-AMP cyclohydrolase